MGPWGHARALVVRLRSGERWLRPRRGRCRVCRATDATRAAVEARAADDALLLPEDRARFTVRLPTEVPVAVGKRLPLGISPDRLYFFDPDTGDALT